jgi:hypothetical protein
MEQAVLEARQKVRRRMQFRERPVFSDTLTQDAVVALARRTRLQVFTERCACGRRLPVIRKLRVAL